jgi:glutamate racemase
MPLLKELLPDHVKIIDSGEAVAKQTKNILIQNQLLNLSKDQPNIKFFTNTKPDVLKHFLENRFSITYRDF